MTWRLPARGGQHPAGVFAVQIDAPHPPPRRSAAWREVVLKVGVLDGEMVQADVQEAGGEAGAQGAVVLQRLAGHGEVGCRPPPRGQSAAGDPGAPAW